MHIYIITDNIKIYLVNQCLIFVTLNPKHRYKKDLLRRGPQEGKENHALCQGHFNNVHVCPDKDYLKITRLEHVTLDIEGDPRDLDQSGILSVVRDASEARSEWISSTQMWTKIGFKKLKTTGRYRRAPTHL